MYAVRHCSVRHAGGMSRFYDAFESMLVRLAPVWRVLGYQRIEKPVALVERAVKGLLFDCRMCGACLLSVTGMACPMNCPKSLRNGPCGGVRADGTCEVAPQMPCVWMESWQGAQRMRAGSLPTQANAPAEHDEAGRSSWLRVLRQDPWPAPSERCPSTAASLRLTGLHLPPLTHPTCRLPSQATAATA